MPEKSVRGTYIWGLDDVRKIARLKATGKTWSQIGHVFGVTGSSVYHAYERAVASGFLEEVIEVEPQTTASERVFRENVEKGEAVLEVETFYPVKTLEDAKREAEVDESIWYVYDWDVSTWTVTMKMEKGQKTVTLRRGDDEEEAQQWQPSESVQQQQYRVHLKLRRKSPEILSIESLLDKLSSGTWKVPVYKQRPLGTERRALEISIMDPHLGLRCFRPAADLAWSLEEARDAFMATVEQLLLQAQMYGPFEQIICPMGNDYFHADNLFHTTTAGTMQPEMEALHQTLLCGEELMLWFTERLRQEAPVKVLSVPGNHDRLLSHMMARVVKAFYAGAKANDVEVDASATPYKFWGYGVNLIGFEHGHSIQPHRLPGLMANETRLHGWQQARYCEWHLGDQHRKGSSKPSMFEEQGVSVEYLPSLTPSNEWHRLKGLNWQKRGAMAFVYDYSTGPVARLQVNFDSYTGKHMGAAA